MNVQQCETVLDNAHDRGGEGVEWELAKALYHLLAERSCPECPHSPHLGNEYQCTAVVSRSALVGNSEVPIDAPFPCGCRYDDA